MFHNLIESRSHSSEFKRRSSFFLFTIFGYTLLFGGGAVASIYAYDAHLDEQETTVVVTIIPPVQTEAPKANPENQSVRITREPGTHTGFDERRHPIASTSQPLAPTKVSAQPNPYLPVRPGEAVKESSRDVNNTNGDSGPRIGGGAPNSTGPTTVDINTPPPPAPVKKQAPQTVKYSGVLNRKALDLPKPEYPGPAKQIHLGGLVSVQVLIDESGRVVSAHAVSGHPFLVPAAVKAAYQARFTPTTIGDTPVKVSGIINYNFVLQ